MSSCALSLMPEPMNTADSLVFLLSASFLPSPRSSSATLAMPPRCCSAKIHTPLYAERSAAGPAASSVLSMALNSQTSTQAPHMVHASVMKALPPLISMAPKGHAVTHVSQPSHLSDMIRTLTGCSLKKSDHHRGRREGRAGMTHYEYFIS